MAFVRIRGEADFRELDIEVATELQPLMVEAVKAGTDIAFARMYDQLSRPEASPDAPAMGPKKELRDSLRKKHPTGRAKYRQTGSVYTKLFWATTHEYGGRVGRKKLTRIPARPAWRVVFERIEPEVDRIFREVLGEG
jgi:hypothetical protein